MAANKKFWAEFLELYQSLPTLWRVKSDEYSNRIIKANAYEKMVAKLKEIEPNADREKVIRKINTFRSNYRRDLKKTKQSQKSGAGAEDIFQSSLWYYDLLGFLEDQEDCLEGRTTLLNETQTTELSDGIPDTPYPPKKRKTLSKEDNLIKMACDHLKEANDDGAILAKGWSSQYNQLSTKQKVFARKIISDVFFYGCLERLNENNVREVQSVLDGNNRSSTPLCSDISASSPLCYVQSPTEASYGQQESPIHSQNQADATIVSDGHQIFSDGRQIYTSVQHLFDSFSQNGE